MVGRLLSSFVEMAVLFGLLFGVLGLVKWIFFA
jgi:hypothetical protein